LGKNRQISKTDSNFYLKAISSKQILNSSQIPIFVKINFFGMVLFIGAPEVMIVVLIVVMLFGADKIPEIARGLGKGMRQIKDATNDIKREINDSAEKNSVDVDITKDIQKEVDAVKEDLDEATGPIKRKF
jgi:sec-independent protein translocase protein TatA